jgi:hypothetical protein
MIQGGMEFTSGIQDFLSVTVHLWATYLLACIK